MSVVNSTIPTVHEFFSPGGTLSRSSLPYEFRAGQLKMARAVEQALAERRHLIVEAGTGTGKTLAYLLPALRHGERVIISTGTKNLQEQLFYRDLPFLESLLGPLRVCYMKGRSNYLCRNKLYALARQPILSGLEEIDQFQKISAWEKTTETGDRVEIDDLPESSLLWAKLDARTETCLGQSCPDYQRCFITAMRRRALESDIIIVNHHLFFADLSIKQAAHGVEDAGILPEAAAVIFDEAHEIEDVASNYFGVAIGSTRFEELARDLEMLMRARHVEGANLKASAETVRDRARLFFAGLPRPAQSGSRGEFRAPFEDRAGFLEEHGDLYTSLAHALKRLEGELGVIHDVEEAPGLARRAGILQEELRFLMEDNDSNAVFWIERRASSLPGGARSIFLKSTPVDLAGILSEYLFESYPTVVLTSATLTVEGGFEHFKKRLGVEGARELSVASHFRYEEQTLLYLPPEMPDPRDPSFLTKAIEEVRQILEITRGRAFCLFTSSQQMREVHDRLLSQLGFPCFLQGSASRKALLEQFRSTPNSVLFATASFWQGVDVQGEALSCVIVDRLPFAVPSDPVVAARMRSIESQGGKPFFEYQVPNAVIALKQGFGRLIRSAEDRGLLVLLDPRIRTKSYGRIFLDSLPPYPVTAKRDDVRRFFAD